MQKEKKYLADLILKHMAKNDLDQKEMAAQLGIKPATLCAWLNPSGHGITRKHAEAIKFVCRDVITIAGNGNTVNSGSAENAAAAVESFRAGLICAFIDSELAPDALQTALKIIKNYAAPEK